MSELIELDVDDLNLYAGVLHCASKGKERVIPLYPAAIRALGGHVDELPDGLVIRGGALSGGEVDCANDHRIVMSMAVAAMLCGGPVVLDGAEACRKSYPGFFDDYQSLGGIADVL